MSGAITWWSSSLRINSTTLASGVPNASGTYQWLVPDVNTNEAGIRLVAYDNEGNLAYDYTNMFEIQGSGTLPTSPTLYDPGNNFSQLLFLALLYTPFYYFLSQHIPAKNPDCPLHVK